MKIHSRLSMWAVALVCVSTIFTGCVDSPDSSQNCPVTPEERGGSAPGACGTGTTGLPETVGISGAVAGDNAKAGGPVIVYGRDACGRTRAALAYLKGKGIPFVYKNIDTDQAARKEMWSKVKNPNGSIGLPVTDIGGEVSSAVTPSQLASLCAKHNVVSGGPSAQPVSETVATPKPQTPACDTVSTPPAATPAAATESDSGVCAVTLYGRDSCGRTRAAMAYLKSKGIAFVYKNIDADQAARKEMWSKVKNPGGSVGLPVTDFCGDVTTGFSSSEMDAMILKHGLKPGAASTPRVAAETAGSKVVVYGTSSCSWCRKAKEYLKSQNVAFIEKDVGNDITANQEMAQKLSAHGKTPSGVPVIDVAGDLTVGFSQQALDQLLKKHGLLNTSGTDPQIMNPGD